MAAGDDEPRPDDLRVYRVLLERPATAAEVAARLGRTPAAARATLRRLTALELVERLPGKPFRFAAATPEVGFGALLVRKERELARIRTLSVQMQEHHRRTAQANDHAGLIETVRGEKEISSRVEQLLRSVREEVRFVDRPPYAQAPTVLHPLERELLGRGVRFRGVYDRAALELHSLEADLEAGVALGEQARVLPEAPLKMVLVDAAVGLIPLDSSAGEVSAALVVWPSTLLDALAALFECLWLRALPLGLVGHTALSTTDLRLLALLTTGIPDRSIAKQLDLSYRTFQRRLSDLMTVLGARTRFQAGLLAAARGWIRAPEEPEDTD
ncbi:helix-turn-helix domain-containing protein [Actinokineospora enzanensis]|uniref:helix-turn-helix domain-containing protein n=1 Tax=Actinokineospora enzanensis TaxID=155975 RepID=UPI0003814EB2|nr:helix-turn-helix domain-containing protein [Actinokineospora enzanensis]